MRFHYSVAVGVVSALALLLRGTSSGQSALPMISIVAAALLTLGIVPGLVSRRAPGPAPALIRREDEGQEALR